MRPKSNLGVIGCIHDVSEAKLLAVVHAGWRGAVSDILLNALNIMKKEFETKLKDVLVYLGPSAKSCCYKVEKDFLLNLDNFSKLYEVIFQKKGSLFFDLPLFVYYKLLPNKEVSNVT